jgi:subtilase family serine protease
VIGLPLRDRGGLEAFIARVSDPSSPDYRNYLSSPEFTARFGPSKEDYQIVMEFLRSSALKITNTTPNRMLVDVNASVEDIERVLQTTIGTYYDSITNRDFHAPDVDPSVPVGIPVLEVLGLDDFGRQASSGLKVLPRGVAPDVSGSGPVGGCFLSNDLRAAYAPGVTLDGSGQTIAIVGSGNGYEPEHITSYAQLAGLPTPLVTNVLLPGTGPVSPPGVNDLEVALDIEMAISMAPRAQVLVYQGSLDDAFNRIATDNVARQISTSYGYGAPPVGHRKANHDAVCRARPIYVCVFWRPRRLRRRQSPRRSSGRPVCDLRRRDVADHEWARRRLGIGNCLA